MQYMLMCCFDERKWETLPESERRRVMDEYREWVQNTGKSGHYCGGAKLKSTSSATTIRGNNGRPTIVDGPFAETKEQLGGYHLLECKDLDEAISIANGIPTLRVGGTIEVRPLEDALAV